MLAARLTVLASSVSLHGLKMQQLAYVWDSSAVTRDPLTVLRGKLNLIEFIADRAGIIADRSGLPG